MISRNVYIQTYGCQMNVYDSGRIAAVLAPLGYQWTAEISRADLVVVNTCAIRAKAEQKAMSFIGRLSGLKRQKPHLRVGVGGCVAQQEGEALIRRQPAVDFVFGTCAIERLPGILDQCGRRRMPQVDIDMTCPDCVSVHPVPLSGGAVTRFVTIMQGCDNFCTYCVVPYVRGREKSRDPADILSEIRSLVGVGVKEVTLLGQNVNSFGRKEGRTAFAELLAQVNALNGLRRIRFTTSHPKDLSTALMESFGTLEKLCRHIHLPVQSGSTSVLRRMHRGYTRSDYLEKIERLRAVCPDIAITTDIIVGFPGETEHDFSRTLDLLKTIRYDSLYVFKYSDRPRVAAADFSDKVGEDEKRRRLAAVLAMQKEITLERNQACVNTTETVLVEGPSRRMSSVSPCRPGGSEPVQWTGRTSQNKVVNFVDFEGGTRGVRPGRIVPVRIEAAHPNSLQGILLHRRKNTPDAKGDSLNVA